MTRNKPTLTCQYTQRKPLIYCTSNGSFNPRRFLHCSRSRKPLRTRESSLHQPLSDREHNLQTRSTKCAFRKPSAQAFKGGNLWRQHQARTLYWVKEFHFTVKQRKGTLTAHLLIESKEQSNRLMILCSQYLGWIATAKSRPSRSLLPEHSLRALQPRGSLL